MHLHRNKYCFIVKILLQIPACWGLRSHVSEWKQRASNSRCFCVGQNRHFCEFSKVSVAECLLCIFDLCCCIYLQWSVRWKLLNSSALEGLFKQTRKILAFGMLAAGQKWKLPRFMFEMVSFFFDTYTSHSFFGK